MGFFKGLWRLIATVLAHVGLFIVVMILQSIFGDDSNSVDMAVWMMPVLLSLVVCVVNVVLYDVLDLGILDNTVGRFIKAVIFFTATIVALILQLSSCLPEEFGMGESEGLFVNIFFFGSTCTGGVATFLWCKRMEEDEDEGVWLIGPISVGISLVVGIVLLILSSVLSGATWVAWLGFILSVGAVVFAMLKDGIPYTEIDGVLNFGSSRSSYSSSSSSSSSSYTPRPQKPSTPASRTHDNYDQLGTAMRRVASRASGTQYVHAGTKLFKKVSVSISGTSITFTISAEYGLPSNVTQSDMSYISDDIQRALSDVVDEVLSEADSEIDTLRDLYTNYDKDYHLATRSGGIRQAY
ncbi:MAG: hypothetical protein E7367_03165 [Clostridiales bacterium]|nr:hypothetical protein [Clostridiales bacterium]